MKEMGWSYKDMVETPIPTFLITVESLNKEAKRQEAEMNKRKR